MGFCYRAFENRNHEDFYYSPDGKVATMTLFIPLCLSGIA